MSEFHAEIDGEDLVVRVPLNQPPQNSVSGKTLVVASTHGNRETDIEVMGQKVKIGLNAYIKKPKNV